MSDDGINPALAGMLGDSDEEEAGGGGFDWAAMQAGADDDDDDRDGEGDTTNPAVGNASGSGEDDHGADSDPPIQSSVDLLSSLLKDADMTDAIREPEPEPEPKPKKKKKSKRGGVRR